MKRVSVVHTSVVSGLGSSLDETWNRLMAGESAIAPVSRFSTERYLCSVASSVEALQGGEENRMEALLDLLFADFSEVPADCRLLLATTKGNIDLLERARRSGEKAPEGILPEGVLRLIARRFGLRDTGININAACASSTIALARGAALIASGRADAVLVCCVDLLSEFVLSGFSALQGVSPKPSRPFDRDRDGLTLGEGGAALLLMSEERAVREGRPSCGTILGWGGANDANHITAPARDGCGLIEAVSRALEVAGRPVVGGISAHGTGTVYNDLMELTAFRALFGEHSIPIHSVKGAIGHTLGAAGGIETALGLRSLAEGIIPPTVGFTNPETGAQGCVRSEAAPMTGDVLLKTNSGFGGVNGALLLGGPR